MTRAFEGCRGDDTAVLSLRYLHGLAYGELAAVLDVAEPTARVRVHRALERLRESSRQDDLDPRVLAGMLAKIPVHAAPAGAVKSAIVSAVARSAAGVVASTTATSLLTRVLWVGGLALVVGAGVGLFSWAKKDRRVEDPSSVPTRATTREEGAAASRLRGRPPAPPVRPASPTTSPSPLPEPTLPAKEPPPPSLAPRPGPAADASIPLRARLFLVQADGAEEQLPIDSVAHRGTIWSGQTLDLSRDEILVQPGRVVVLSTSDARAAFPRVAARVPAAPAEVVVRIPAKGSDRLGELTLEVVDEVTGAPLPSARLAWGEGAETNLHAAADAEGRIRVRIPGGASTVDASEPALVRFDSAERVVHAPGYYAFGDPWGTKEYVPTVSADDLASWMERGVRQIALKRLPVDDLVRERSVRLLDAEGRPAVGAYVLVFPPLSNRRSFVTQRLHDGFRRADAQGMISFPMGPVVCLEVRVDRVPVASWGLSAAAWPAAGPRVLHLPGLAEAELIVEDLPGHGHWARDPLGARRMPADGPSFAAVYDPEAQAYLAREDARLHAIVVDRARGDLAPPRSTLRFPLPLDRTFTLHLWAGGEHRTWTVEAEAEGPLRLVQAWEDLPLAAPAPSEGPR